MSKKNFTAVREGNSLKVMCDGVEILDTTCDRFGIELNTYDIALMTTKVDLSPKDVAEMLKVIKNVYDPGKKEIPPYKASLFRNGEHVTHVKSGDVYVVVGTPSDGYIIEETLEHAYCYKKLKPKNIAEMNRKWIRSQTKMEDGRFVSGSTEKAQEGVLQGNPCGEVLIPASSDHRLMSTSPMGVGTYSQEQIDSHNALMKNLQEKAMKSVCDTSSLSDLKKFLDDHLTEAMCFDPLMISSGYPAIEDFNEALIRSKLEDFYRVEGAKRFEVKEISFNNFEYDRLQNRVRFRIVMSVQGFEDFYCDFVVNNLPSKKSTGGSTFDGVLTSNEIERAADKAIEMGYDGKDREIVFKAAHAVGLGSLIPSLLNEMGNAVPNVVSIQRAADRKLEEKKTAQVSGVSAAATSSGDGGSIFGEVLEAVGDVAMGALDSVGDVCSGIGECAGEVVGGILSGIGDGL
jgi:hypothetical protein